MCCKMWQETGTYVCVPRPLHPAPFKAHNGTSFLTQTWRLNNQIPQCHGIKALNFGLSSPPFNSEDDFLLFRRPISPHMHLIFLLHTLFRLCSILLANLQSSLPTGSFPLVLSSNTSPLTSYIFGFLCSLTIYCSVSKTVAPHMLLS